MSNAGGGSINSDLLNSWKEVAAYMGRGVRTVQRWEREMHLPIRRPRGRSRSAIIAMKNELDEWLRRSELGCSQNGHIPLLQESHPKHLHVDTTAVKQNSTQLRERCFHARQQAEVLNAKIARTIELATRLCGRT